MFGLELEHLFGGDDLVRRHLEDVQDIASARPVLDLIGKLAFAQFVFLDDFSALLLELAETDSFA